MCEVFKRQSYMSNKQLGMSSRYRFRFDAPFVSNMLRRKTSLKYGTYICLASLFNCILVVASDSIFIVSLAFFFLAVMPCLRLYGSRYSPYLYEQDIIHDPVPSCDRDIARVDIAQFCCRLPLSPC